MQGGEKESKQSNGGGSSSSKSEPVLKGVMRVGVLAKGLLLRGDTSVELVVLCGQRPTHSILDFVANHLPVKLTTSPLSQPQHNDEDQAKYNVEKLSEEAALIVKVNSGSGQLLTVKVDFTSPLCREMASSSDADNGMLLNRDKCLQALANLRHAKWFQARAARQGQSCIVVIRVMRDLCRTVHCLTAIRQFTLELLVEKVLASAPVPLSPGDAFRRVFEAVAGGLLLGDSPGLLDPCEREPRDATENLSVQQREDITSYAQTSLRKIAFRNIHQVLGMEAIPPPRSGNHLGSGGYRAAGGSGGPGIRKRKLEDGSGEGEGGASSEPQPKKEPKEEGSV